MKMVPVAPVITLSLHTQDGVYLCFKFFVFWNLFGSFTDHIFFTWNCDDS